MEKKEPPDIATMSDEGFLKHLQGVVFLPENARKQYRDRVNKIQNKMYTDAARLFGHLSGQHSRPTGW